MEEIINNWLTQLETDLIKNYDRLGLRASGRWAKSLDKFIDNKNNKISLGIKGERYTGALEYGRKKTTSTQASSPTLREQIRKWIDDKGITPKDKISKDSLAYLIARKIHKEGIKVPNKYNAGGLVTDVITKKRIQELNKAIGLNLIATFKSDIIKDFK